MQRNNGINFEKSVAIKLSTLGWNVKTTERTGDGGIDLTAIYGNDSEFLIVQCKDFNAPVGPDPVRIIFAASRRISSNKKIIPAVVSSRGFTRAAREEAQQFDVLLLMENELIDGCILDRKAESLIQKEKDEIDRIKSDWDYYNKNYPAFLENREKAETAAFKSIIIFVLLEALGLLFLSIAIIPISFLNIFITYVFYKKFSYVPIEPKRPDKPDPRLKKTKENSYSSTNINNLSQSTSNDKAIKNIPKFKIDPSSSWQNVDRENVFSDPFICSNCNHENYVSIYHNFINDKLFCEKCGLEFRAK